MLIFRDYVLLTCLLQCHRNHQFTEIELWCRRSTFRFHSGHLPARSRIDVHIVSFHVMKVGIYKSPINTSFSGFSKTTHTCVKATLIFSQKLWLSLHHHIQLELLLFHGFKHYIIHIPLISDHSDRTSFWPPCLWHLHFPKIKNFQIFQNSLNHFMVIEFTFIQTSIFDLPYFPFNFACSLSNKPSCFGIVLTTLSMTSLFLNSETLASSSDLIFSGTHDQRHMGIYLPIFPILAPSMSNKKYIPWTFKVSKHWETNNWVSEFYISFWFIFEFFVFQP